MFKSLPFFTLEELFNWANVREDHENIVLIPFSGRAEVFGRVLLVAVPFDDPETALRAFGYLQNSIVAVGTVENSEAPEPVSISSWLRQNERN